VKKVKTADGSLTFYSEKFQQTYHSTTAGALREAVEKFCKPCKVEEKAKKGKVNLLDSCFGLGYNTFAFIQTALSSNPRAELQIISFERDLKVIEESLKLNWKELEKFKPVLRDALKNKSCQWGFLTLNYFSYSPKVKLKVFIGEGREVIKKLWKRYRSFADAVFHDPFSPSVNPELWSYEFFLLIRKIIKEDGVLATYSGATPVRRALHMAGFGVREGIALGRKSTSTLASPRFKTQERILKKFSLPSGVPFRDPELKDPPELITSRRQGCVNLLRRPFRFEELYSV
jgi:tRNA U34 5-methylaminomethyl-2-thiouridine-forming methyltransferase MnmC